MHRNAARSQHTQPLFFPALGTLLDNLLPLGVDLLIVDFTCGLAALLALRRLGLHADGRRSAAADLLLGILPGRSPVINFVSGGWESVIFTRWMGDNQIRERCAGYLLV